MATNVLPPDLRRGPGGYYLPPGMDGVKSVNLGAENIGPNAEVFKAPSDESRHDYLRDIGQFSSRIPGLIQEASVSGPAKPETFGGGDPAYAAIQNRSNQQFQQNVKDFGNRIRREETQVQDNLLTNELKRRNMNLDYQIQLKSLRDAQWAARRQKRSAVLSTILGVGGTVGGFVAGGPKGAKVGAGIGELAGGLGSM